MSFCFAFSGDQKPCKKGRRAPTVYIFLGIKITDEESAWKCVEELHNLGPRQICITSTLLTDPADQFMIGLLSDRSGNQPVQGKMKIPIIRDVRCVTKDNPSGTVMFTGTGDMFAACLSGHSREFTLHSNIAGGSL